MSALTLTKSPVLPPKPTTTAYPTIDPSTRGTIRYEHGHRVHNVYGNVYVTVPRYKVANRHGYGHHMEHASTVRSRALHYLREVLGSDWAIRVTLYSNIVGGETVTTYAAVKVG